VAAELGEAAAARPLLSEALGHYQAIDDALGMAVVQRALAGLDPE
jgi:hypothetical protein